MFFQRKETEEDLHMNASIFQRSTVEIGKKLMQKVHSGFFKEFLNPNR